jgi:uncharacterized protein (DUF2336 family)
MPRVASRRLGLCMSAYASLIPELEDVIQHGSYAKRAETVRRIASLFIDGAASFNEDHIGLFDDVLCRLVTEIETMARAEMARTLAPIENAPGELMRELANDEDIKVAGPVIAHSARLAETDLVSIAETKGQAHLFAISGRNGIGEAVTDVLVRRGDSEVVRNVADNKTAKLSDGGFSVLVKRAADDGVLAEKVGLRQDIPPHLFRELLVRATAVVQQRLLAAAKPETKAEVQRVLDKVSREFQAPVRDYSEARKTVLAMHQSGKLSETELANFAKDKKFEETVASLSVLCNVPIEAADRLANGDRPDPILILCKAAGFSWPTARAIISSRPSAKGTSNHSLDALLAGPRSRQQRRLSCAVTLSGKSDSRARGPAGPLWLRSGCG